MTDYYYTPKKNEAVIYIDYDPIDGCFGWHVTRNGRRMDDSPRGEYDTQADAMKAARLAHPWLTMVNPWNQRTVWAS